MAILNNFPCGGGVSGKDIGEAVIVLTASSFVYDGSEKTQAITSVTYDGTALISGTDYIIVADSNKATNAGTHTIILAGIGNYTGIKTADWSIAKAQGSITSPVQSIVIDNYEGEVSYIMSVVGDGVLSTSCPDGVQTIFHWANGNTVIIQSSNNSGTILTVTLEDGNNYLGASTTINVTAFFINSNLINNTTTAIKRAVDRDIAKNIWSVGDRATAMTITQFANMVSPDAELLPFVLGFDHNESIEGKGITFMFGQTYGGDRIALVDSNYGTSPYGAQGVWFRMQGGDQNTPGWENSQLRTLAIPLMEEAVDSNWSGIISTTTKYSNNSSNQSPNITATQDKFFALSEYEVFGQNVNSAVTESDYCQQYDYFRNGNSKVFKKHSDQATTIKWHLRSNASASTYYYYCCVNESGNSEQHYASRDLAFAPVFRVGPSNEVSA